MLEVNWETSVLYRSWSHVQGTTKILLHEMKGTRPVATKDHRERSRPQKPNYFRLLSSGFS